LLDSSERRPASSCPVFSKLQELNPHLIKDRDLQWLQTI
jgi:hypothetical protein